MRKNTFELIILAFLVIIIVGCSSGEKISESELKNKYNNVVSLLQQKESEGLNVKSLKAETEKAKGIAERGKLKEAYVLLDEIEKQAQNLKKSEGSKKACTMDAKICPDGTSVGRAPPNCEFATCPEPSPFPVPSPEPLPEPSPIPGEIIDLEVVKDSTVKQMLDTLYPAKSVSSDGSMSTNQKGYTAIAFQDGAINIILRGIADDDKALIEKGVQAIEYGFQQQDTNGNFKNNQGLTALQAISADAFFMNAVGYSALVLKSSKYNSEFMPRIDALKPKIEKSMDWLAKETSQAELKRQDSNTPNRLIVDANAYLLNGIYLGRSDLQTIGDDFIDLSLSVQRTDGVIPEKGGHDSSYQSVSILHLSSYHLWTPNSAMKTKIYNALKSASSWEKSRINANTGIVSTDGNTRTGPDCKEVGRSGQCKDVNYPEVAHALAYWSVIGNDVEAGTLSSKVLDYIISTGRIK